MLVLNLVPFNHVKHSQVYLHPSCSIFPIWISEEMSYRKHFSCSDGFLLFSKHQLVYIAVGKLPCEGHCGIPCTSWSRSAFRPSLTATAHDRIEASQSLIAFITTTNKTLLSLPSSDWSVVRSCFCCQNPASDLTMLCE